jgi:PEP-CTERM motif
MKTRPGLRPMLSLVIFVLISLTSGLQCAHGDTVSMLTGDFPVSNGGLPLNQNQDFTAYVQFDSISETLTVNPSIGSYVDRIECGGVPVSTYDECDTGGSASGRVPLTDNWSGTFSGGSVSLTGPLGSFAGTITRGSFSGSYYNDSHESSADNIEDFSFTGTWANGWRSEGTFSGFSALGVSGVSGDLTLTTNTIPEPGSMALFAAGMAALAALLRRTRQVH